MKISTTQPVLNVLRSLLNQEGYVKDFADFYEAGKTLSTLPQSKLLGPDATPSDLETLVASKVEFELDDKSLPVIKRAFKHYIDGKKQPSEHHFNLAIVLGIDPKASLS